ncbi:hypothetical protein FD04_GL002262 [Secundilactobacillus odoratitofui DSM 19909 = JCM 15043]|uniref:Uncharacterized protein n=1 Tax=Secundilactobacillus odoratitofui DSM 19909 = JCM 15043 TaxID=1423776 RepID=A0A0R1LUG1_9LACO|nr:DUF1146 family protein [Secundilactobacillus odoratitofui]KRK99445.1 hypothetical protein FD04_GL002262 [Secundilactobacillus odoratitofui DSM 19909 = JCM 15043]
MQTIGAQALLTIVSHFVFIFVAFWSIQKVHIENVMRLYPNQARVLIVLLSVAVGYTCSEFFLNFIDNVRNLIFLVK